MDFHEAYEQSHTRPQEEMMEALDNIRVALRGKTKAEIMEALSAQDSATLRWICEQVALPTEDYEICGAAQAILKSRDESL